MRAVQIHQPGILTADFKGLRLDTLPIPDPQSGEVLVKVAVCGVCHTEIDEIEARTPPRCLPMTPGHQAIGIVVAEGPDCQLDMLGKRVGVAWIHSSCGRCVFCCQGLENLCDYFLANGRDRPGGYAEYMTAPEAFIHEIPAEVPTLQAAPLLCAGAVGFRSLGLTGLQNGENLGLTGFGASGQLVLQMARHLFPDSSICVFARSAKDREFALDLGAAWAGDTREEPPLPLHAVIDTTPAWLPVLCALKALTPGGRLVINAIRKETTDSDVLNNLNYEDHLWKEKVVKTVANVTRKDVRSLLRLAADIPLTPTVTEYPLEHALDALVAIKSGRVAGAAVLRIDPAEPHC